MSSQAIAQEHQQTLERAVRSWDRRWRMRETLLWLPRSLIPGLLAGILIAIISRLRPWLLPTQILSLTAAAIALGLIALLGIVWLRPRPVLQAARRFDLLFGLDERVSTALELLSGRIRADDAIGGMQIDDARRRAQAVRPAAALPLRLPGRDWLLVLALLGAFGLLVWLPNPQADVLAGQSAERAAIEDAAETLRDAAEQVATDPILQTAEREALLQALDTSIKTLEQPNISPEEAFAALSDAQSALRRQADLFNQQLNTRAAAMNRAAEALGELSPETRQAIEEARDAAEAMQQLMNDLAQSMNGMSAAQQQQLAQAMQQAAGAMQNANPQAARQMQQAAQAMQNGQAADAQSAMQQANDALQEGRQEQQAQQQASERLDQAAQQAQQAAQDVAQAGQQGRQSQQAQQGQQGQSQQDQSGQQGQAAQDGQSGQQAGEQGQPGESGAQSSQQGGQAEGQQSVGQQGSGEGDSQSEAGQSEGGGQGAGDAPGGQGQESGGSRSQGMVSQGNNPDGEGQSQFAPVFAPRRIGGEAGGEQMSLESDGGDAPVVEGEFAQNPAGESVVPYNEVYADYANAANRALESDYIPLGLRDVVRDYFTSLEPANLTDR